MHTHELFSQLLKILLAFSGTQRLISCSPESKARTLLNLMKSVHIIIYDYSEIHFHIVVLQ